jgi:hypothetical protein
MRLLLTVKRATPAFRYAELQAVDTLLNNTSTAFLFRLG